MAARGRPARGWPARVAVHCATLLVVTLPAMVAGAQLAAPPGPFEPGLVEHALLPAAEAGARSEVVTAFVQSVIGEPRWPVEESARLALLLQARLAQVIGLWLLSGLLYGCVLLASGRVQALLACVCLALFPSVCRDGPVLRPETPAVVLAMFAILLLQCLTRAPRDGRQLAAWSHWLRLFALAMCAMVANALAAAALPSRGEVLLVPGLVLTLAALQMGVRGLRIRRRRSLLAVPLPAINRRLLPWTAMAVLTPGVACWLLTRAVVGSTEALVPTLGMHDWLPEPLALQIATIALMVFGGFVAVVRIGMRFGRASRLGPDLVLLVAAAVALAVSVTEPAGQDGLPAALPTAVLCSEGLRAVIVLLRGRVSS